MMSKNAWTLCSLAIGCALGAAVTLPAAPHPATPAPILLARADDSAVRQPIRVPKPGEGQGTSRPRPREVQGGPASPTPAPRQPVINLGREAPKPTISGAVDRSVIPRKFWGSYSCIVPAYGIRGRDGSRLEAFGKPVLVPATRNRFVISGASVSWHQAAVLGDGPEIDYAPVLPTVIEQNDSALRIQCEFVATYKGNSYTPTRHFRLLNNLGAIVLEGTGGSDDCLLLPEKPEAKAPARDESAESFIRRAVERGAGVPGQANVLCGSMKAGRIDFLGKFTWKDADQFQRFRGRLSGSPGNWRMDEFQMFDPIDN